MSLLANSNAIEDAGYKIQRSLRFRSSASAYLSRTPASAGNRLKWTWSGWVKRGALGGTICLMGGGTGGSSESMIMLDADCLRLYNINGAQDMNLVTTAVYRDPSAWYHFVVIYDAAQATQTNRASIYVNGVQVTSFSTSQYPASTSQITIFNGAVSSYIGLRGWASDLKFDGYLAEVNFIDGQALTPSSFGQTDPVTGVWTPKKYTGTYGTNGFYLPFSDNTSATTLAYDKSGNGNNWTPNNISTTAGATYDSMTDVPTLTSATAANYCVWNAIDANKEVYTNGNLSLSGGTTLTRLATGTIASSSGKFYWEYTITNLSGNGFFVGIAGLTATASGGGPNTGNSVFYRNDNGNKYVNGTSSSYGASWTTGDVIGVALDLDANTVVFYKNNTSQGSISITADTYRPSVITNDIAQSLAANFGQRPFSYTPPTGFKALNTFNLPDPTIKKPNQYMDVSTWTGTGSSLVITNSGAFQPDFVWGKSRSLANSNILSNSVAGSSNFLKSNNTSAEGTSAQVYSSFNSNGFTLGTDTSLNTNGSTNVGWQWQAGKGTTSSNTSGSITSNVSVNTTAGFSVVTYTGNSTTNTNYTIGHGLGVAPKLVIIKSRTWAAGSNGWAVWHSSAASTIEYLDSTDAASSGDFGYFMGSTAPTSSVFTVRCDTTPSTGARYRTFGNYNYVAYCWAEIAGFSKFGSYTGNGSADGPFVYCGFRPKYVMVKDTSTSSYDWFVYDSVRNTYNPESLRLNPNTSNAEFDASAAYPIDFCANGYKIRGTNGTANANGSTYIYAAFAESPFKYALGR